MSFTCVHSSPARFDAVASMSVPDAEPAVQHELFLQQKRPETHAFILFIQLEQSHVEQAHESALEAQQGSADEHAHEESEHEHALCA